jgi:hypothetical protein
MLARCSQLRQVAFLIGEAVLPCFNTRTCQVLQQVTELHRRAYLCGELHGLVNMRRADVGERV